METPVPAGGPLGVSSPREGPRLDFTSSGHLIAMKHTARFGPHFRKFRGRHVMQLQPQKQWKKNYTQLQTHMCTLTCTHVSHTIICMP